MSQFQFLPVFLKALSDLLVANVTCINKIQTKYDMDKDWDPELFTREMSVSSRRQINVIFQLPEASIRLHQLNEILCSNLIL